MDWGAFLYDMIRAVILYNVGLFVGRWIERWKNKRP